MTTTVHCILLACRSRLNNYGSAVTTALSFEGQPGSLSTNNANKRPASHLNVYRSTRTL